jgi:hypothetical protein
MFLWWVTLVTIIIELGVFYVLVVQEHEMLLVQ